MAETLIQHLLLVEDEDGFREVVAERLGEIGYRVEQAATGGAALERLNEFAFDVIITDLRLPDMDGRQVLDEAFARVETDEERWTAPELLRLTSLLRLAAGDPSGEAEDAL